MGQFAPDISIVYTFAILSMDSFNFNDTSPFGKGHWVQYLENTGIEVEMCLMCNKICLILTKYCIKVNLASSEAESLRRRIEQKCL